MLLSPRIILTLIASHWFGHAIPAAIPSTDTDINVEARGTTYPSVSGRLFNINGKTQYFSGESRNDSSELIFKSAQGSMHGGLVTFSAAAMSTRP